MGGGGLMTIFFECDKRFNWRWGICKRRDVMTRVWWLWFAVGFLHIPFEQFAAMPEDWYDGSGKRVIVGRRAE